MIDLQGKKSEIILHPGEMLLYESAKMPHGRVKPFKGNFFDNVFVHFKPSKAWYDEEYALDLIPEKIFTKADLL